MTGAAGGVGGHLRRLLAARYDLVLTDARPLVDRGKHERFTRADLARAADAARVTKGVDAIVHLGGYSVEGPWAAILEANVVGAHNLFEAARKNGVRRVVFASSHHAVGFHRRTTKIDHRADVRPDTRYGVSKVFGEALGRLYADKYGLEVFCVRIGNVNPEPIDERRLAIWSSPRDLAQLIAIGIDHPDVRFEIVYGVSNNQRSFYDNANAARLGYQPQDDSEPFAATILAREPPADPVASLYQGGHFTVVESVPNPAARPKRPQRKRSK
ncbi:MAG TPA: NAD(P)-dependent oxidoreductase [Polyangia bacterium]|nr:NAD(P)-dependent oxidoreductase [Polyangia bacterium]